MGIQRFNLSFRRIVFIRKMMGSENVIYSTLTARNHNL